MTETEKLQRSYDALSTGFVSPLVRGGTVTFEGPIAPGAIQYFEHASSSAPNTDAQIFDALHRGASVVAPVRTVPWPDRDLVLLAMASYDLVLLTDPALDRTFARSGRRKIAGWIDEMIEAVGPPGSRADALARHALLDPLPKLRRRDVVAKSWAYTYRFVGRPVGSSILSKPVFGRFDESSQLVDLGMLLAEIDEASDLNLSARLRELLARSPVTELVRLDLCDPFRFGLATLSVLSDDALRGGIAREIVSRGEWDAAPALGRALGDPLLEHAPAGHLYYALALCFDVQMTAALDVPESLPKRLDLSQPDTARYAAVLPAFLDDPTMIEEIRAFDPADRAVMQERAARLAAAIPKNVLDQVVLLVRRCERPGTTMTQVEVRP